MPYLDELDTNNRLGYNKDGDDKISKYSRLNDYYDSENNKGYNHGHEVLDIEQQVYMDIVVKMLVNQNLEKILII